MRQCEVRKTRLRHSAESAVRWVQCVEPLASVDVEHDGRERAQPVRTVRGHGERAKSFCPVLSCHCRRESKMLKGTFESGFCVRYSTGTIIQVKSHSLSS